MCIGLCKYLTMGSNIYATRPRGTLSKMRHPRVALEGGGGVRGG